MADARRHKLGLRTRRGVLAGAFLALVGAVPAPSAAADRVDRPTRRIDVVVNLDPDARSYWSEGLRSANVRLAAPTIGPAATIPTTIRDPRGRSRRIEIHWARRSGSEWVVAVTPPVEPVARSIFGKLPPGFGLPPDSWGAFRFDARGELIGPDTIEVVVPAEPSRGFGSGDPNEVHPEQKLALRLRSRSGATTQFASAFVVEQLVLDGRGHRPAKRQTRACSLDPRLRGDPVGGEGASLSFDAPGRLVPNARQHFVGYRIDPVHGVQGPEPTEVRIPMRMMPPHATTKIALELVRASNEPIVELPADPTEVPGDARSPIWLSVYDPLGRLVPLELRLIRSGPDTWSWFVVEEPAWRRSSPIAHASFGDTAAVEASLSNILGWDPKVPRELLPGSTSGLGFETSPEGRSIPALEFLENTASTFTNEPFPAVLALPGGRGRLRFDLEGWLVAVEQEGRWLPPEEDPVVVRPARSDDELDQPITLDLGVGRSHIADAANVLRIELDGDGPGTLTSLRVTRDFVVEGIASNGVVVPLSALAFAEPGERVCDLACSNGRDDDRDGRVDFGEDAGCLSSFDGSERSPILACDDGLDGDGDGLVDFPADPSCVEPEDEDESPPDA